jgi:L-fuculose-phosphate aldolase
MRDTSSGDSAPRPSSELGMHLACYAARPDVVAVVHAHPPVSTGFATAGRGLPQNVLPELPVVVGPVALVPYGRPGTPALSEALSPFLPSHEAFLLANHGVTAMGRSLTDAVLRLESIEQGARILFVSELLGGARPLPDEEFAALRAIRARTKAAADGVGAGNA